MMFPMLLLEFSCPFSIFHKGDRMVKKGWKRRSSEGIRWAGPEAWCGSCCHFHIDWCQRWIWVKATTAMLILPWSLFRKWLDTLWQHNLPSQHHCGMLSYKIVSFYHKTCKLSMSNNWNFFSNFNIYCLWGCIWKSIKGSWLSLAPCIIHFVYY